MVVCLHAQIMIPGFHKIFPSVVGRSGVDIFFAISGFVMVYVTSSRLRSPKEFILARIIRIVPVYWFYTFGVMLLMVVAPTLYRTNELSVRHLVLSLLFIPHHTAVVPDSILPMVKVGWTLIYEMSFYLVFALAMVVSFRRRIAVTAAVLATVVAISALAGPFSAQALLNDSSAAFYLHFYGYQIVLEFVLGMLIAAYYLHGKLPRLNIWIGVAIVLLASAVMLATSQGGDADVVESSNRLFCFGIPAAAIVLTVLLLENSGYIGKSNAFLLIGDASYSIYLVHMLPLALLRWAWPHLHMPETGVFWGIVFILVSFVVVVPCGIASYLYIERPAMRYLRRLTGVGRRIPVADKTPAAS